MFSGFLVPFLGLAGLASAHGYIDYPAARQAGAATTAACGKAVADSIRADNTSHVEGLPELAAQDGSGYNAAACNLWLCRGIQFDDNKANVQTYAAGETVDIRVRLTVPHDGSANVSVVDTATNEMIGSALRYWPSGYANEKEYNDGTLPANNTAFDVTLPDVSARCSTAGACVLQWWWYGVGAKQTYESCVDFVMTTV